jgi:dynein heavy chain
VFFYFDLFFIFIFYFLFFIFHVLTKSLFSLILSTIFVNYFFSTNTQMANNVFRLFTCMSYDPFNLHELKKEAQENDGDVDSIPKPSNPMPSGKDLTKYVENLIIFCIIWSLGGVVDKVGRVVFNELFQSLLTGTLKDDDRWQVFMAKNPNYQGDALVGRSIIDKIPEQGMLFDYRYNCANLKWEGWMKMMGKEASLLPDAKFNDIIIPTIDTVRQEMIVQILIEHKCHVLLTGQTGTGKSVSTKLMLTNGLDQSKYMHILIQFSAQTTENQTQDIIDGKLGKRRKGVFGPTPGFTSVVFVDDLIMPKKEEYGAQPPIEILRAWMDHEGWYDRFDPSWSFRKIQDIQFVAAMGPPGGGRSNITQRYVRHFNMINYVRAYFICC